MDYTYAEASMRGMIGESEDDTTDFIDMLSESGPYGWICVGRLDNEKCAR